MSLIPHLAKHFREVHYGVNWTWSNIKAVLSDVTWQESIEKVGDLNTIVALTYHIHYYVKTLVKVMEGDPLDAHDKYAFDHPEIKNQQDWESLLKDVWSYADKLAKLLEQLPEERLWETFSQEKYGNYFRNITGVIEHTHYHLGQIVIIKKLIRSKIELF
ncbi:MAG: DinB family protein [Saprospiraceae bacterium]